MKKSLTALLLIVISLTLTGCTLLNKNKEVNEVEKNKTTEESITSKVSDLFNTGNSKECTYEMKVDATTTTGHMYISGKKMAHTATIKMEDKEQVMNYIMDEDWLYSWGDGMPNMKMNLKDMEKVGKDMEKDMEDIQEMNTQESEEIDYNKLGIKDDMNLNCKNWNVDASKFELPKGVEFTDITKTMTDFTKQFQQTTEKADDLKDSMCGACNMTPDEQTKKECLASLGCK